MKLIETNKNYNKIKKYKIRVYDTVENREPVRLVMDYKKPMLGTYTLHNRHSHPIGSQFFIFALNSSKLFEILISSGTNAQVLGPLKETVSVPYRVVCILVDTKLFFFLRS